MSDSNSVIILFSRILPPIGVFEIGLRSFRARGGFSFGIGTISEILYASGNIPDLSAQLVISEKGSAKNIAYSSMTCLGKSFGPRDFFANFIRRL